MTAPSCPFCDQNTLRSDSELAARYDEVAHAPATEADRVFRRGGEICTPRMCWDDASTSSCCVYITHTLHPRHHYASASSPDAVPDRLTRDDITSSMSAVRGRVAACRDTYPARGRAAVRVAVAADGTVEHAAVDPPSGDAPFDACLATAARHARFPRSEKGVRFRYPIPR